jgi:hypothetical protein
MGTVSKQEDRRKVSKRMAVTTLTRIREADIEWPVAFDGIRGKRSLLDFKHWLVRRDNNNNNNIIIIMYLSHVLHKAVDYKDDKGEWIYSATFSWPRHEGDWSVSRPCHFNPEKEPPVPIAYKAR